MNAKLTRKIDRVTTSAENKAKALKRKARKSVTKYAVVLGALAGTTLAMVCINGLNSFYAQYELYFRSPLQNPIVFHERVKGPTITPNMPTSTPTPQPKKKPTTSTTEAKRATVDASKYPAFIEHIWLRESGRGTNTSGLNGRCIAQGKTNEFGFAVRVKHCFDTFEESVARLERWREEEAKGLDDNTALCYYNMGKKINSCAYLGTDFLSMN